MVESPCIQVCTVEDNVCTACGRTVEEVVSWSSLSDEEKKAVRRRAKNRKT